MPCSSQSECFIWAFRTYDADEDCSLLTTRLVPDPERASTVTSASISTWLGVKTFNCLLHIWTTDEAPFYAANRRGYFYFWDKTLKKYSWLMTGKYFLSQDWQIFIDRDKQNYLPRLERFTYLCAHFYLSLWRTISESVCKTGKSRGCHLSALVTYRLLPR